MTKTIYGFDIVPIRGQVASAAQAQSVIDSAITVWMQMGLSTQQIMYGVSMLSVESGYIPTITNGHPKETIRGLGQFNSQTWGNTAATVDAKFDLQPDSAGYISQSKQALNSAFSPSLTVGTNAQAGSSNDPNAGQYDPDGLILRKPTQGATAATGHGNSMRVPEQWI